MRLCVLVKAPLILPTSNLPIQYKTNGARKTGIKRRRGYFRKKEIGKDSNEFNSDPKYHISDIFS